MKLPSLTELARGVAVFQRYQDGKLWYEIEYYTDEEDQTTGEKGRCCKFEFPILVDAPPPAMMLTLAEIHQALNVLAQPPTQGSTYLPIPPVTRDISTALDTAIKTHTYNGPGEGAFLPRDKGIRFLRWIRPHLELLRDAKTEYGG